MKRIYALLLTLVFCSSAFAGRVWITTEIKSRGQTINTEKYAMAMRSGQTWPVIAYNTAGGSPYATGILTMTPAGWVDGKGVYNTNTPISSAQGPDGSIGFAYGSGQVQVLSRAGWSNSYVGQSNPSTSVPSIAISSKGTVAVLNSALTPGPAPSGMHLSVYNGNGWINDFPVGTLTRTDGTSQTNYIATSSNGAFAMEYDSYDQFNIAFRGGEGMMFGTRGVLTGNQWAFSIIEMGANAMYVDMAMAGGDVPYVAYCYMNNLMCATYDRQQNSWATAMLGAVNTSQMQFSLASDSKGGVGIAFAEAGSNLLNFAYNDGTNGWQFSTGIGTVQGGKPVSLAFDAKDNPLICYMGTNPSTGGPGLMLAYDPIIVPEPISMILFAGGCMLMRSRRK